MRALDRTSVRAARRKKPLRRGTLRLSPRHRAPLGDTSLASASMVEPGGRGGRGGRGGSSTGKGRGRFGRGGEGSSNKVVTIFKPEQGTKTDSEVARFRFPYYG